MFMSEITKKNQLLYYVTKTMNNIINKLLGSLDGRIVNMDHLQKKQRAKIKRLDKAKCR